MTFHLANINVDCVIIHLVNVPLRASRFFYIRKCKRSRLGFHTRRTSVSRSPGRWTAESSATLHKTSVSRIKMSITNIELSDVLAGTAARPHKPNILTTLDIVITSKFLTFVNFCDLSRNGPQSQYPVKIWKWNYLCLGWIYRLQYTFLLHCRILTKASPWPLFHLHNNRSAGWNINIYSLNVIDFSTNSPIPISRNIDSIVFGVSI